MRCWDDILTHLNLNVDYLSQQNATATSLSPILSYFIQFIHCSNSDCPGRFSCAILVYRNLSTFSQNLNIIKWIKLDKMLHFVIRLVYKHKDVWIHLPRCVPTLAVFNSANLSSTWPRESLTQKVFCFRGRSRTLRSCVYKRVSRTHFLCEKCSSKFFGTVSHCDDLSLSLSK